MKKFAIAAVILAIFATPAFAKVHRHTVKYQTMPRQQCALWAPQGCATPLQYVVSPVVTAGEISMGIINGMTAPFR